jgi:hypothetical protein
MRLRVRFNDSIDRGSTTHFHLKIVTKRRAPVVSSLLKNIPSLWSLNELKYRLESL